jgi:hypothetical protein
MSEYLLIKIIVYFSIFEFGKFPFIPTGNFAEIFCEPGNAFDFGGTAINTFFIQPFGGFFTGGAECEFRIKINLTIAGIIENLADKPAEFFFARI